MDRAGCCNGSGESFSGCECRCALLNDRFKLSCIFGLRHQSPDCSDMLKINQKNIKINCSFEQQLSKLYKIKHCCNISRQIKATFFLECAILIILGFCSVLCLLESPVPFGKRCLFDPTVSLDVVTESPCPYRKSNHSCSFLGPVGLVTDSPRPFVGRAFEKKVKGLI